MAELKLMPMTSVQVGRAAPAPVQAGGWLSMKQERPPSARERLGFTQAYDSPPGGFYGGAGHYSFYSIHRNLMPIQYWQLYRSSPDVRACIDSIVRRVATWDWYIKPTTDPRHTEEFSTLTGYAKAARDWLAVPNRNGETWQEVMTKMVTDLLIYDAGVLELASGPRGELQELVSWLGSTWFPVTDEHGVLLRYEQEREVGTPVQTPAQVIPVAPERLAYFSLFKNNRSNLGLPLLDTCINECITTLLASEHAMLSLDADEIPPGLLVLGGVAGAAAERARADLQVLRGKDQKLRVLTSPQAGGIDAKWIELRRTSKDLQLLEVVDNMRRIIWRTFGVQPVELGESEGVTRATAHVQLDVSSSHLLTPILELVQARINTQILPRLLPREAIGKVVFAFDREQPFTPQQRLQMAQASEVLVKRGVMTVNEVRADLGLLPVNGGDVPTVDTNMGPMPLAQLVSGQAPANTYAAANGTTDGAATSDANTAAPLVKAVGDTDPTNFPAAGQNKTVSLRNSQWELFDAGYAEALRKDYPSIWRKGGNTRGNSQYDKLMPIVKRGGSMAPRNDTEEGAIRLREAWVARHRGDFRLAGVVAQVKWLAVGDRGERYMKDLLDAEKAKVDANRAAGSADDVHEQHQCSEHCNHSGQARAVWSDAVQLRAALSRAEVGEWLPSDWQPAGRFAGMRTLNLRALAEVVAEYNLAVAELYDRASALVQASVAASYGADGVLDIAEAGRAQVQVEAELDKLVADWAARTEPLYLRAAKLGHDAAERFTMAPVDAQWRTNARTYWQEAMGWLAQPSGLVGTLRTRCREVLNRATLVQRSRVTDVDPSDTMAEVVEVVRDTFAAQAARIDNWSGLLVGLSNRELTDALDATVTTVNEQPVEWWVEWVNAGGRSCPTCDAEGAQGFVKLGDLSRRPGEDTLCLGHCRCVLVFWTGAEVANGSAVALSALAPSGGES